jgi:glycosyltransferase involved in cell wall biosynthesis
MEPDRPIVSVILPCYNAETVVSAAIGSVAESSLAPKCELIIVNDGSTDHTQDVIDAACKRIRDLNIKVIKTENRGVSKARNTALDAAEGKYIVFLDADDRISPCMLENMVSFSEERGADFSYCEWTSDPAQLCANTTIPESTTKDKVFSTLLYRSISLGFTCVLYRREIIEKYALRFDDSLRYGEDLAFLWKYALRCSAFLSFPQPFYFYARDNKASAMHRVRWEMTDVLKAVEQIRADIPQQSETSLQKSYDEYMIPRYILYLQKDFAAGNDRELFEKLRKKYPSLSYRAVIKKARFIIQVSAIVYCVSPSLYFHLFHRINQIRNGRSF